MALQFSVPVTIGIFIDGTLDLAVAIGSESRPRMKAVAKISGFEQPESE